MTCWENVVYFAKAEVIRIRVSELTTIADAKQEGVVCCEVWVVSNEQEIVIGVWVIGDVAHVTLTPSVLSLLCNMFP